MPSDSGPGGTARRIDQYRVVRRLAMGGMAEILLAVDERTGREVALKRILPQIATDTAFLDRFFHEIRIQISLKHKNVVELLDCSPAHDNAYIVMEYIDGGSLAALRQGVRRFPWELALYVAGEALRGLGAAHKKGIVHRDVKPQNIMWTTGGAIKIADFGISQAEHLTRLTVTGTVVGTPSHMSPEQARGEVLDSRSDLFSIGTVLYELLTGVNPFNDETITGTLRKVVDVEPEPPSLLDPTIPSSVDGLLRKLHAKDRTARFGSADETCEAIRGVLAGEGVLHVGGVFKAFLEDPPGFVASRDHRLAAESAATAEKLLADGSAPPEEALWAAYRTLSIAPDDPTAKAVFHTAATRVGHREKPVENARIRELEAQLRKDPDNVALLLQLAKLYRLEKDFVNLMRFFKKLQSVASADNYTQGQIAALVGSPAASDRTRRPPAGARAAGAEPAAAAAGPGAGALAMGGLVVLLVASGIWWARRPPRDAAVKFDLEKAAAALKALKGTVPPTAPSAPRRPTEDEALQKALEKGALLEKEGGASKAISFYREALLTVTSPDAKGALLLTIAGIAGKAGDREGSLRALDEAIALGGAGRPLALYDKAGLLETAHDAAGAQRLYEELAHGGDEEMRSRATLKLAMAADRAGDTPRALTLYEDILAKFPRSREANPARLGAGALYTLTGRKADARRMLEDVKQSAVPGSDEEKSADAGLKLLE